MKYALAALMIAIGACSAADAHDTTTPEQELASEIGKADLKAGIETGVGFAYRRCLIYRVAAKRQPPAHLRHRVAHS
jgi:hypothetical protein